MFSELTRLRRELYRIEADTRKEHTAGRDQERKLTDIRIDGLNRLCADRLERAETRLARAEKRLDALARRRRARLRSR